MSSGLCTGSYSDPWKSDQKVKTVVLQASNTINLDSLPRHTDHTIKYLEVKLSDSVKELRGLAESEEAGIDADLY